MAERKTITLFIYVPDTKEVILSRRGKLERHAGVLQATVHGQIEPGEISQIAMKREFAEEVKGDFSKLSNIVDFGEATVGQMTKEHTYYHGATLPTPFVEELQPTQEVAELIFVSEADVKQMTPYSKVREQEGFDFAASMVMFDDEIEVLKKIFKQYAKLSN